MNLLHIGKFYPPYRGGMESYLLDLAEAQVKQGHQVTVIVHNHDWKRLFSKTHREKINGVDVIRQVSLRPVFHTPLMVGLKRQIKQLHKEKPLDLIHLHTPNPSLFGLLWSRSIKSIPWFLSWHSDMVTAFSSRILKLLYFFIKPLENKLIRNCQAVLISSKDYAEHSNQLSTFAEKVKVVPLGINPEKMMLPTSEIEKFSDQWQKGKFRLFTLGRLTFYKNHHLLIAAMQQLPDCQLIIAGGGKMHQELAQHIVKSGTKDRVKLLGEVDDLTAQYLFSSCDLFCLTSHDRAESFGVVLLEAMYHNKMILVSDTKGSGMAHLAAVYNKGFTFQNDDIDDFVKTIHQLKNDRDEIVALPKQFDYHIEKIAKVIDEHYQSVLIKNQENP